MAEDHARKILLRDGDGPKLKFPDIPTNLEDHDKKFDKALENTNKYKVRQYFLKINVLFQTNTSKIANEGLESLVEASRAVSAMFFGSKASSRGPR